MSVEIRFGLHYPEFGSGELVDESELQIDAPKYAKKILANERWMGVLRITSSDPHPLQILDEMDYTIRKLCTDAVFTLLAGSDYTYEFFKQSDDIWFKHREDRIVISGEELLTENDEKIELNVKSRELLPAMYFCALRFFELQKKFFENAEMNSDWLQAVKNQLMQLEKALNGAGMLE